MGIEPVLISLHDWTLLIGLLERACPMAVETHYVGFGVSRTVANHNSATWDNTEPQEAWCTNDRGDSELSSTTEVLGESGVRTLDLLG